jgi:hypothetical protein
MALAPSNDDFDDAIAISEGIELWADTSDGTVEAGEVVCGEGPTAYWKFTAPAAGDYLTYATGSNYDTQIGWSTSVTVQHPDSDCPDDSYDSYDGVEAAISLTQGEVAHVQISSIEEDVRGSGGVGVASVSAGDDAFADRSAVTFRDGASTAVRGIRFSGVDTVEAGEPLGCGPEVFDETIWLTFTPSSTQAWYLEAKFDDEVYLSVYSGSTLAGLSQLSCSAGERHAVVLDLTGGTTYTIQLDNQDGGEHVGVMRAEPAGAIRSLTTVIDLDGDGTSTTVGESSAAILLDDGRPAVAYDDDDNDECRFAERSAGGVWSDVLIDADGDGTSTNVCNTVDLAILDDGRPVVAYRDSDNEELRFAERSAGGVWSDVLIDADGDGTSTDVGDELSLVILNDGRPAVAYRDSDNEELRFAVRSAGGVWSDSLIDADGDGTSTNVGSRLDMIVHDGVPVVAYKDSTNSEQRLAVKSDVGWTESMVRGVEVLTEQDDGPVTYYGADGQPSLATGPDGTLRIAVQDDDTGHTWYGTRSNGGTWTIEEILTDRLLAELGWSSSVELNYDRAGNPVVIWADNNYGYNIGASVWTDGTWIEQVTTPFLLDPTDPSSSGTVNMQADHMDSVVMPDGRIAFTAYDREHGGLYWVEDINRVCPTDATPFTDVSGYADDIACIFGLAVTGGTSPTTYSPTDYVTRQQMAAFLARIYREMTGEECSGGTEPFTDVSASSSAKDDIACIFGLGITGGTSPTTYSPAEYVTRQQMAAFLARLYRTVTDPTCSGGVTPFTDVSAYADDIACIFGLGITGGTSPTTYSPTDYVTRQQMAAFLARTWRTPALLVAP